MIQTRTRRPAMPDETPLDHRVNVRLPIPIFEELTKIVETLGLDVSPAIRMMVIESLPRWRARAEKICKGQDPDS